MDLIQKACEFLFTDRKIVAAVKHICDLCVAGTAFSRSRRYYIASGLVCPDDISYFFELFGTSERTSTEFYYFLHLLSSNCILFQIRCIDVCKTHALSFRFPIIQGIFRIVNHRFQKNRVYSEMLKSNISILCLCHVL